MPSQPGQAQGGAGDDGWLEPLGPAFDDIRQVARGLFPGARVTLRSPAVADAWSAAALRSDRPFRLPGHRALAAGVALRISDGSAPAILTVEGRRAQRGVLQTLARLARMARNVSAGPAEDADARREAFTTLVRSIPVSVVMTDMAMRVLAASPRWAADLDVPEQDAVGRTLYEIAPEYYPNYRQAYERCLAGETIRTPLFRSPRKDGRVDWLRTELTPWRDSGGRIGGLIALAVDITDVVVALERVERSEQRLKVAVEIADLHVWEVDLATKHVELVGAVESFFDEDIDLNAFAHDTNITIHPEDRARLEIPWRDAVMRDEPFRPEYRINRKDGKEVWATCTTKLVRDAQGQPARLLGAMQNITDRKQAEAALMQAKDEAEAANRAKSAFLATMSHEIRTPLNGVLGMAQAMAAGDLAADQRKRLETIRESGETLLVILNDLLDLSKIEAGKLELEVTEFELSPLVEGVHAAFAGLAAKKGLEFRLDIAEAARGRYRGDCTRLRQILYNLVSNGLKFTEAGQVRVTVGLESDELVVGVLDTGIGIPAERLPRLFRKFEQVDASTTRRFGGTGLGLAICRDLATLMGGAIEAESEVGRGSAFRVRLPLERIGEEAPAAAADRPTTPEFTPERPLRVLAAEDNSVNQLVLRTLLQQVGVDPVIVGDGAEALAAWRAERWDVILMDVQMPVMDGPSATREIRRQEASEGRPRTPILALTANAMAHQVAEYRACGMDGFIAKPIRIEELLGGLQAILDAAEESNTQHG